MLSRGLISHSADLEALYRRCAYLVDKILKGSKLADLPIELPTKFWLAVNLKTDKLAPGDGDSAELVARGEFIFSLVDTDDIVSRVRQHQPLELVYPDQGADGLGCFLVPNATVLIDGAPHRDAVRKLIDYLLSKEVEAKLARSDAAQIPLHPGVEGPPELLPIDKLNTTRVNYAEVAATLQAISRS